MWGSGIGRTNPRVKWREIREQQQRSSPRRPSGHPAECEEETRRYESKERYRFFLLKREKGKQMLGKESSIQSATI